MTLYSYNYNKVSLFLIAFILLCVFIPGVFSDIKLHYRGVYASGKVESIVSESEICTEGPRGRIHTCVNRYAYIGFDSFNEHKQIKMLIRDSDLSTDVGTSIDFIYDPMNLSNFQKGRSVDFGIGFLLFGLLILGGLLRILNFFKNL